MCTVQHFRGPEMQTDLYAGDDALDESTAMRSATSRRTAHLPVPPPTVSRICSISAYPTASDGRRFEREGPDVVYRALIADNEQSSFAAAWPKSKAGGH